MWISPPFPLMSFYYSRSNPESCVAFSNFTFISPFILPITPRRRHCYSHFTEDKTEAHRGTIQRGAMQSGSSRTSTQIQNTMKQKQLKEVGVRRNKNGLDGFPVWEEKLGTKMRG